MSARPAAADRGGNRFGLLLIALVLIAAGVLSLLAGAGVFGSTFQSMDVFPRSVTTWIDDQPWFWWAVGAVAVIVGLIALRWLIAQLRTNRVGGTHTVDDEADGRTTVHYSALAGAVGDEIEGWYGVRSAHASFRGSDRNPTCEITVTLDERGDLEEVRDRVQSQAVPHLRDALDDEAAPVEVRFTLAANQRASAR